MLQASIEGYEDAIVVPRINANNFELKQTLINLVQKVPNTTIKLLLFPFSLEGEARTWLDKEPPHSILTWEDLVSKFINQFFPPSKTTYLQNDIINFLQKPNETFNEAWERFKSLLRQCPHHGGNFLDKIPRDGLAIIESKSKVRYSRSHVTDSRVSMNAPLLFSLPSNSFELQQIAASLKDRLDIRMSRFEKSLNDMKAFVPSPTPIKKVEEFCVTCGSNHSYNHCPLTRGGNEFPIFHDNIQQFQTAAVGNFSLMLKCGDTPSISYNEFESLNKIDLIDAGESDFYSEKIENFLNDDSIPIGIENSVFDVEEDILFLERLLNEVAESGIKNLVPIPRESDVTSDNESESNVPVKDDSSVFTTFSNPLFNDSNDFKSNDNESIHDVPIEESKVCSNPLFDDDEINSNELESHVESNFVESLSNHDHLEELLMPIHIAKEERIKREHVEYISRMEMLFTINPRPCPTVNANMIVESFPSSLIQVQDNDSQREEIDIVTNTDVLLPPGFENDDLEGEINAVEELHVDNSISNSENELSDNEASDNPSFPRPPPKPPV
nr:hypothetical protein [Tanacetum cinerariifolium]